ncbi:MULTISPECIES: class I SAM-dependent methyltransferase [Pseudomonas]|uniref:Class I SAM-dependent methyltransferase n=1 Tax=Pseudomonas idahonensis TaxID=2942628 RepID=A0ABT5QAN7_9PSED|nr:MULTISPECIES: class I SAM-dependent methyltransferase [Pseudomonas]MCO7579295.1 class I SAM-dependent methyltransferase [Pseudomonas protegens]MCO7585006.1 class I SAM-dependent methyltransferase [Pseudomonas chlororaphis]MCO7602516.1 class I SAM-dependent methyltransferase [Pseudomonas chlororaphis]MDD1151213.1 class I SAM-dependent methyltransferase [Pseudomonas idahonensis]MDP9509612.1 class I SAM-dependent methyltransferase [Pseudomonas protegens]
MSEYLTLNKTNWDERAPLHAASADYAVQRFVDDPQFLSDVVQFDRPLLGDIQGLRGVHLQCHIGTDTLSLARLGARMSGLDFSSASLAEARTLAQRCNTPIDYHESDVFAATDVLPRGEFDLVYTGIGALCWLPSIERWAQTVGALLKPGGRLFIREGHPMLWALDEEQRDSLQVAFPYFERSEPLVWDEDTTYVETESSLKATVTHEWNHGLGEIISALLAQGLEITGLVEHQSIPWEALPGQMVVDERGEWRLKEAPWRLPLSYTLQAVKRLA